jgi:hypothetical protein
MTIYDVSDLRQSRRLGGGGAAQSRRALRAKVWTVKSNQRAPVSLAPRGTSGERAGERSFLHLRAKLLLSPAQWLPTATSQVPPKRRALGALWSSFLRQEARESGIRHFGHSGSQSSTPGTVKLCESSSRAGGFPFGFTIMSYRLEVGHFGGARVHDPQQRATIKGFSNNPCAFCRSCVAAAHGAALL